jgi:hypothetical protein
MSRRAALVAALLLATSPLALAAPEAGPAARDDTLLVSLRSQPICGREGRDVLVSADSARDIVRCGAGRDRVVADRRDRVSGCGRRRIRG